MTEAPREIIRFKGGTVLEGDIPDGSRLKQFSHDRYVRANAISLSDALAIPEVAALVEEKSDKLDEAEEALRRIVQWADAYPLDVFPEPDLKAASEALKAAGITLDAVSAHAMRHVITGAGGIARAALRKIEEGRG